jgi:1,2-diacylglycerol-3-alpha-glucose alpha-1,2-galactosyltransferase
MKIHIVSETKHLFKGNGVHTAFLDHVELMGSKGDVETVVNNKGLGDVYHSHTYGPYYFLKGLPYRGKRIHTVHVIPDSIKGSIPMWKTMMPVVKWYFKRVYSYADVCLAISPMVEEAIKETGADTEIIRIQNPINVEKWQRTPENRVKGRAMLGLSDDAFVVLGVGQLQARKGVEDFIDVAAAIPDAQFVWVGGRPLKVMTEGISRIDARMAAAPDNLQFTGLQDLETMPLMYAAADVMLFPSYQENCPLAPIEGAAAGLPVVFRDIEEYRHLYEYAYIKASSTEDFIAITRELKYDRHFYADAVSRSKQLVVQFDKDKIREKLINVYERLNNGVPSYLMAWLTEG